jgi:hypothetical protein
MPNFKFDVDRVTEQLNRILQMELAGAIYYTHYSFMLYGHARIPITQWLQENATESLAHAQEAGQMIMRLHKRPDLGIAKRSAALSRLNGDGQRQVDCTRGIRAALGRGRGDTYPRNGANADEERARVRSQTSL